jgi:hypothetical protein
MVRSYDSSLDFNNSERVYFVSQSGRKGARYALPDFATMGEIPW